MPPVKKSIRRIAIYKASSHPKSPFAYKQTTIMQKPLTEADPAHYSHSPSESYSHHRVVRDRFELIQRIKRGESPTWSPPSAVQEQEEHQALAPVDEIERPKSAFHSGDFTHLQQHVRPPSRESNPLSWSLLNIRSSLSAELPYTLPLLAAAISSPPSVVQSSVHLVKPRLSSLPSSHIPRSPTSPLHCSTLPSDYDYPTSTSCISIPCSLLDTSNQSKSSNDEKPQSSSISSLVAFDRPFGTYNNERSPHFHQRAASSPSNNRCSCPRRASFAANATPERLSTLVGSYEESILRGRMSSQASRPLSFNAKIGVLGRGSCRPKLRCPPHVEVEFPAVFYKYASSLGGSLSEDGEPSPYVGTVDLENDLSTPSADPSRSRRRSLQQATTLSTGRMNLSTDLAEPPSARAATERWSHPHRSLVIPPGGSYPIPSEGQLQIVIKNPNKTAVKLFLIPYNVREMQAGQKTFIRYRAFSSGPIVEKPLSSTNATSLSDPRGGQTEKAVLRYLLHLHICCPTKGHYFLYKSIRIVFANRVPDGKERLKEDISYPEPRYSTYKLERTMLQISEHNHSYEDARIARRRTCTGILPAHRLDTADGIGGFSTPSAEAPHRHQDIPVLTPSERQRPLSVQAVDRTDPDRCDLRREGVPHWHIDNIEAQTGSASQSAPEHSPSQYVGGGSEQASWSQLPTGQSSTYLKTCSPIDGNALDFRRKSDELKGRPFTPPGLRGGESLLTRRFRGASNGP